MGAVSAKEGRDGSEGLIGSKGGCDRGGGINVARQGGGSLGQQVGRKLAAWVGYERICPAAALQHPAPSTQHAAAGGCTLTE